MVENEDPNSSPRLTLERGKADLPGALLSQEAKKQVYFQRGPCVPDAPGVTRPGEAEKAQARASTSKPPLPKRCDKDPGDRRRNANSLSAPSPRSDPGRTDCM